MPPPFLFESGWQREACHPQLTLSRGDKDGWYLDCIALTRSLNFVVGGRLLHTLSGKPASHARSMAVPSMSPT